MQFKQLRAIVMVLLAGAGAAFYLTSSEPMYDAQSEQGHGHDEGAADAQQPARGPHGGRWFEDGAFGVEVTIFEAGVPPEFRLYLYLDDQPLVPDTAAVSIELNRLGQEAQRIQFAPQADYLRGASEIVEPHSFAVKIAATHQGKHYQFSYEQQEARVRMSDEHMAQAGIELETAAPTSIAQTLSLPGEIRLNGDRLAHVVSPLNGVAVKVSINAGEKVAQGTLLAVISSQALAELRHAVTRAQAQAALARESHQRERRLWQEGIAPEQDYQRAEHAAREADINLASAGEQLRALGDLTVHDGQVGQFELRAPIAGTVIDKHLAIGEGVSPETRVFTIADLSSVWAEAKVGARELVNLRTGQPARIGAATQALSADGQVSYLSALLGEQDRAVTARVVLDNVEEKWRPGLPVTVEIVTGEKHVSVAVSLAALHSIRDWQVVFGRYGEYFEARPLKLGARDDHWVEVISGLRVGERYAVTNSYRIKADLGKAGASHDH